MSTNSLVILGPSDIKNFCNPKVAPLVQQDKRVLDIFTSIYDGREIPDTYTQSDTRQFNLNGPWPNTYKTLSSKELRKELQNVYRENSKIVRRADSCSKDIISFEEPLFILPQILEKNDETTFNKTGEEKVPVLLEELFTRIQKNESSTPCRAALCGDGGVGKTTLCQYITYSWAEKPQWHQFFDWIFLIPLREVNNNENIDLINFVYQKWFISHICKNAFENFWRRHIRQSDKVLFLFDGYDELSDQQRLSSLLDPYPQAHVLMTSRRCAMDTLRMYKELNIKGFKEIDIYNFIHFYFKKCYPYSRKSYRFYIPTNSQASSNPVAKSNATRFVL